MISEEQVQNLAQWVQAREAVAFVPYKPVDLREYLLPTAPQGRSVADIADMVAKAYEWSLLMVAKDMAEELLEITNAASGLDEWLKHNEHS